MLISALFCSNNSTTEVQPCIHAYNSAAQPFYNVIFNIHDIMYYIYTSNIIQITTYLAVFIVNINCIGLQK